MINIFKRAPKYDWELQLRKTYVAERADLAPLQNYITELKFSNNHHTLDVMLEFPSKTEKEVEDIKSRMLSLNWEVIFCDNKGLTTTSWWEYLLDRLPTYEKEKQNSKCHKD